MKSDYSSKIPSLPHKKEIEEKNKNPNKQYQEEDHRRKSDPGKRPESFDGLDKRKREPERQHYPFLTIYIDFLQEEANIQNGEPVHVSVTNNGNGTSYTPFVELIESTSFGLSADPPNPELFHRRGYRMLSVLYPHQTTIVQVPWSRHFIHGRIVGICYDPLLDPRPKIPYRQGNQPLFHQKITSYPWWNLTLSYIEPDGSNLHKR